MDGVVPGSLIVGDLPEVQTVIFRGTDANTLNAVSGTTHTITVGVETTNPITYGADPSVWKMELEKLYSVNRVTVTRNGDGVSAIWYYGYSYTITFWGEYGVSSLPQVVLPASLSSLVNIFVDTPRNFDIFADHTARYIALNESTTYAVRVRAINAKGISAPSDTAVVTTERYGGLSSAPASVVIGQFLTNDSLSLNYQIPKLDGGIPITSYRLELDSSAAFDPSSAFYSSTSYSNIPEVQQITTYFRSGDNVQTRGGFFALTFAGKTTADLNFDISAYDLESALNTLIGTRVISVPPVTVSRAVLNRGYKWLITFNGIPGDIGLIQIDYSLLQGDDPRMLCTETVKGFGDIVPGAFTAEVQVISTYALSVVGATATFNLTMQGYTTPSISSNASAVDFKQKLESIATISTVGVTRSTISQSLGLYAWTVTFKHMKHEVVQGAGDIPPFTVASVSLFPAYSGRVNVFEMIKGTHPLKLTLSGLQTGLTYFGRLLAYNERGYSLSSYVTTAQPLGQPKAPVNVLLSISSATSLKVSWSYPTGVNYQLDQWAVEWYTAPPVYEVQIITTSSSASLPEIQRIEVSSDSSNLAGYFRLQFMGETTQNIAWNAMDVGDGSVSVALARLSTMSPVIVTRDYSKRVVQGLRVTVVTSLQSPTRVLTVTLGVGTTLKTDDQIWIGDVIGGSKSPQKFKVVSSTSSTITLDSDYLGDSITTGDSIIKGVKVYKWSYGYTWDIQFVNQIGDMPTIVASPADNWAGTNPVIKVDVIRQGVAPLSGTFRVGYLGSMTPPLEATISAADMEKALEALDTISDVSVARYRNGFGYDWHVTFNAELGNLLPMYTNDAALSGPFARAGVSTVLDGVAPAGYQITTVAGGNTLWTVIPGLTTGLKYQVRVRAHNLYGFSSAASVQYTAPLTAPSAPFNATIFAMSISRLKLVWQSPLSTGGAPITQYRVQWDLSADFKNVVAAGTSRDLAVTGSDTTFCFDIDIPASSSNIARYAQVFAFNGFQWSSAGFPTPRSSSGAIKAPGAPVSVNAYASSSVGIIVSWLPPNGGSCAFGGDGGSPVSQYVVEWDTRSDFGSPAARTTISDVSSLFYEIGGRDFTSGNVLPVLQPGYTYYIRVTAFNSIGSGVAGYAASPVVTTDTAPSTPINFSVFNALGPKAISTSWASPLRDGGATIEKYRLTYSTNSTFGSYRVVDLPLVSEVQTVVAEAPVVVETQAIRVIAAVTNERQTVRTQVNGVDEIQTITTSCDDVVNEVQRVTTSADDIDEVQTVELISDKIPETQLIQTYTDDVPEIQVLQIASPWNLQGYAVQKFGVILQNVNTQTVGCVLSTACSSIEDLISGKFRLAFRPSGCGGGTNPDSNWCQKALIEDKFAPAEYDCTNTGDCVSNDIDFKSTSDIINKICALKPSSGTRNFMAPANFTQPCVDVNLISNTIKVGQSDGVYEYSYQVTFRSNYLRGKVSVLEIKPPQTSSPVSTTQGEITSSYLDNQLGVVTQTGLAFVVNAGNQPTGGVNLAYKCESRTMPLTSVTVGPVDTAISTIALTGYLYQWLRIGKNYVQIIALSNSDLTATISPALSLVDIGTPTSDAEVGVFYSDPTQVNGVSTNCLSRRIYTTGSIFDSSAVELDLKTKLRGLSQVIDTTDDNSIIVTRSNFKMRDLFIGYRWTITFTRQNGDLNPLQCIIPPSGNAALAGTGGSSIVNGVACTVETLRNGSLFSGNFQLGISFPHKYVGTPAIVNNTTPIPWNIDATNMMSILTNTPQIPISNVGRSFNPFGTLAISRVSYVPTQPYVHKRWSGQYRWTVSFVPFLPDSRTGMVPPLVVKNSLTVGGVLKNISIGTGNKLLPNDDPKTAIVGNQIGGSYALSFRDNNVSPYTWTLNNIPVTNSNGQALSGDEFKALWVGLFGSRDWILVQRSLTPNDAMGYTYTITFRGRTVGGRIEKLNYLDANFLTMSSSKATNKGVKVLEATTGAQLQGSFQLSFKGYTTGALPYNADASEVQQALNDLTSIAPSKVIVTRDGPMMTPSTQVYGYVWSITFNSNRWVDPTASHDVYVPGSWVGAATTVSDVWDSGYSKAWGKNVGNMPLFECGFSSSLFVTNDGSNAKCLVETVVNGTEPLSGTFKIGLDTTGHSVINIVQALKTSEIPHNAFATAVDSGGDGSSLQEKLQALGNIGEISVRRSAVNPKTGGYTWWVTFLRDKDFPGGQFNGRCQQKDSFYNLCNSPGDVPKLTTDGLPGSETGLFGKCVSFGSYICQRITIMDGNDLPTQQPPGSKEYHLVYVDNPLYDPTFKTAKTFKLNIGSQVTQCMSTNISAAAMQAEITSIAGPVQVTSWLDTVNARNSFAYGIRYYSEGNIGSITATKCPESVIDLIWNVSATTIRNGSLFGMTQVQSGVVHGNVLRGKFTTFKVTSETGYLTIDNLSPATTLSWNMPAEPDGTSSLSLKTYLESNNNHIVNVTRTVIGKYGVVEYNVRFVQNKGMTPPGSGDIPALNVIQGAAVNNEILNPVVTESMKGSTGISGRFYVDLHSPDGPRLVEFNEPPIKLKRKLQQFTTIENVLVTQSQYPSSKTGGWGAVKVDDGALGGLEFQVYFLRNPGTFNGFSFPPGSGNIDPLTVTYNTDPTITNMELLAGTKVAVQTVTYTDGSTPIDGSFTLALQGASTGPLAYNQQPLEAKYLLEALPTVGEVSTGSNYRFMQAIPGIVVSALRDSDTLLVEYTTTTNATCGDYSQCPWDLRQFLAPGDLIRVGGLDSSASATSQRAQTAIDGAPFFDVLAVDPQSPLFTPQSASNPRRIYPQEILRVGGDNYTVVKTGMEIQTISISCPDAISACGNFQLNFLYNGISATTACFGRAANGDMPSAATIDYFLEKLTNINKGDIYVSRSTSLDLMSYVYTVYFEGTNVAGDTPQLTYSDCAISGSGASPGTGSVSVFTVVHGGFTTTQTIRVNTEAGYIAGPLFNLVSSSYLTGCVGFGDSAAAVQSTMLGVTQLTDQLLPFTIKSTIGSYLYEASSSVYGILNVGDILHIVSDVKYAFTTTVTVVQIQSKGKSFIGSVADTVANTAGIAYLYHPEAVQVSRTGTGNSTATVLSITSTADAAVPADVVGYYRLRLIMNGVEKQSSTCLKHHATAGDMQTFINNMGFDFTGDGFVNASDYDHIVVSRSGDGSYASGYGYTYTLTFSGPLLGTGRSTVLGNSKPFVQVINMGYPACSELANSLTLSPLQITRNSWKNLTTLVATGSTLGYLQPGDRIQIPGSSTPSKIYKVIGTGLKTNVASDTFVVDVPVDLINGNTPQLTDKLNVYKVTGGVPVYTVEKRVEGEDSYTYNLYFSGKHLSSVPVLNTEICNGFAQFNSMRYGADVTVSLDGGSIESLLVSMTSPLPMPIVVTDLYWKFVYDGINIISLNGAAFPWGAAEADVSTALNAYFNNNNLAVVSVSRSGFGTEEEQYGFKYAITFSSLSDLTAVGQLPLLSVLTNGSIASPQFYPAVYANSTEPAYDVNDLVTSGSFLGPRDYLYVVEIVQNSSFIWYEIGTAGTAGSRDKNKLLNFTIVQNKPYTLSQGVVITFSSASPHRIGSMWQFVAVQTPRVMAPGASITTTVVRSGNPKVPQITLDKGYQGEASSTVDSFNVPPVFAVADQSVPSMHWTTKYAANLYGFKITVKPAATSAATSTVCIAWNAYDRQVEDALFDVPTLCPSGTASGSCLTVLRSVDNINNANGYVFDLYFENAKFYADGYDFSTTTVTACDGNDNTCTWISGSTCLDPPDSAINVATVSSALNHNGLTASQLPLAYASITSAAARYRGPSITRVPLYKVNGNIWTVTFDTNIGDIPALSAAPTGLLTAGTNLKVYDNVVQGKLPATRNIDTITGIDYFSKVQAYTRGYPRGYGAATNSSVTYAASVPPALTLTADSTMKVDEVQEVVVGATRMQEIQNVTTSAVPFPEVQEIALTVAQGQSVAGNFALRYPEVQTISLLSTVALDPAGKFALQYRYQSDLFGNTESVSTICLPFTTSAADLKAALTSLTGNVIDDVVVVRTDQSGYTFVSPAVPGVQPPGVVAGPLASFGYVWTVSFVGNKVAGNVMPLEIITTCSTLNAATTLTVATVNENQAIGLDTEVQRLTLTATDNIAQGQYQLSFRYTSATSVQISSCIAWNAAASDLQNALNALPNIDNVFVERFGNGDASSSYGYTYSIYFTGNLLHLRSIGASNLNAFGASNLNDLGQLTVVMNSNGCSPFKHFKQGVLTAFNTSTSTSSANTPYELYLVSTKIKARGFRLSVNATTADILKTEMSYLPSFSSISATRRTLAVDNLGYRFTLNFGISMGNAPQLVCGMDSVLAAIASASCASTTVIDGNYIGGYFILGNSQLMPSSVSAADMTTALQLVSGMGTVSVSRTGPDNQGGYTWLITYLTSVGNVPLLSYSSSLTGAGVSISLSTVRDGNYLGGSYTLQYNGYVSAPISPAATVADMQTALQAIIGLGKVDVGMSSVTSTEGGRSYVVTFRDTVGDVPSLIADASKLTGAGVVVGVYEVVKGAVASGSSLKISFASAMHCSHSQVPLGECGSNVDLYELKVGQTQSSATQTLNFAPDYTVQRVRLAAQSLFDNSYFTGVATSGYFQLTYNGETTGPISAVATASDLRLALEALTGINTVKVERSFSYTSLAGTVQAVPGLQYLTCLDSCGFPSLFPGELISVGGGWYKVAQSYSSDPKKLPLALMNDSSVITSYSGLTSNSATIARWARGYEWTVSFLSVSTPSVVPLGSMKHGLNPVDSAVSIRPKDCVSCLYINGLTSFSQNFLTLRARNSIGFGNGGMVIGVSKEIPQSPSSVRVESVSGSQMTTFFAPPSSGLGTADITSYTVQWDTNEFFTSMNLNPSCSTSGYGSCDISGSSIQVNPPFQYLIQQLSTGTKYYVRVAARNSVSAQQASSNVDFTKWSGTVNGVPNDRAPSAPIAVVATLSGKQSVQVLTTVPISTGGQPITAYKFEWDSAVSFASTSYSTVTIPVSQLNALFIGGPLVYEISPLTTGATYNIRVSAVNIKGTGPYTLTTAGVTLAGKPLAPSAVTLSMATAQSTPITSVNVSWTAPSGPMATGGSPVTGYLIEWWDGTSLPEIQIIRFTAAPGSPSGTFSLKFQPNPTLTAPPSTSSLSFDEHAIDIRSELMNIAYDANSATPLIGDVRVTGTNLLGKGYQWTVTFNSAVNQGDQVRLVGTLSNPNDGKVDVIESQDGRRAFGSPEIQILQILTLGSTNQTHLNGYFRMSFNGSASLTPWLPVGCSKEVMERSLVQLSTLRAVTVNREIVSSSNSINAIPAIPAPSGSYAGYRWTITFSGDVGNQPVMFVEYKITTSDAGGYLANMLDGDNSLDSTGMKISNAFPGEMPVGYNSRVVDSSLQTFTIPNLVPGKTYYVAVSAINSFGIGARQLPAITSIQPPKQIPQPPTNVSVDVNYGSANTLKVSYSPPLSDGGDTVSAYRIELDTTSKFLNPVYNIKSCPSSSLLTVYQIKTSGFQNDPIKSGSFQLRLAVNGASFTTEAIPFDAPASMADEPGLVVSLSNSVTKVDRISPHSTLVARDNDYTQELFQGNRLKFGGQLDANKVFTVLNISYNRNTGTTITLDTALELASGTSPTNLVISRYYGGRGPVATSRVTCTDAFQLKKGVTSPTARGSIEAKLEAFTDVIINGVQVDRDEPDATNGMTWRVTFLDPAPPGALNFALSILDNDNKIMTAGQNNAGLKVSILTTGAVNPACTGTFVVPFDKALSNGQYYSARVFAGNDIGYSLPQPALKPQKPMVVPGPPTAAALSVVSQTALRVVFNPPASDGGDTITSYVIEYATTADFSNSQKTLFTYLSASAPFSKTIDGLKTGVFYFVRVSAANSQGYGNPAVTTPSSMNPYQTSDGPTNVLLRSTSDSMLTVSFDVPANNGGDAITGFRVEWDTDASFESVSPMPHNGFVDLDAASQRSFTIQNLMALQTYYVRVSARNSAGLSAPTLSSPPMGVPAIQVPGKPHTIIPATGDLPGQIDVSWQYPRVPWHSIPCSGMITNIYDCPTAIGGGKPASNGGSDITEYVVSYNEKADFSGFDGGEKTTTLSAFTLTGLTPGRVYFIRVLARNSGGSGQFCNYAEPSCLVVSTRTFAIARSN